MINFLTLNDALAVPSYHILLPVSKFSLIIGTNKLEKIDKKQLIKPYDFLLTQPLMTIGLEQYYKHQTEIQKLYVNNNKNEKIYSRIIMMLIDTSTTSNDREQVVVELALISINFKALPANIISKIINTNTPLGKLLKLNNINIYNSNREYFKIQCNAKLAKLINCQSKINLYGRINTLNRADNNKWIAHVIEILPNIS